jgi:hypothetical protein
VGFAELCGQERVVRNGRRDNGNNAMTEKEMVRRWAQTWKQAGPELERIRLREVRDEDNLLSLKLLARAFNHATSTHPPDKTSGLVEMQRYFAKLRR